MGKMGMASGVLADIWRKGGVVSVSKIVYLLSTHPPGSSLTGGFESLLTAVAECVS
jgi:hypothetical protein